MTLIGAAKDYGIEFIYAISPGLDITFSNQKEVSALKRKLDQVIKLGYVQHCITTINVYFPSSVTLRSSLLGFSLRLQVICLTF